MATIVMEASKVIEAALNTIAAIKYERTKRDESEIEKVMQSTRIGAWFKTYNPTREKAISILDASTRYFGWRSVYAWGDLSKAEDLLRLAKLGDPVTLNEEDCRVLF